MAIELSHERAPRSQSLRAQTPAALLMMMALAALTAVNGAPSPRAAVVAPASACASCGEVVAVRPVTASKFGLVTAPEEGALALDVRMQDGSLRTIRHDEGDVRVGMRVRVDGGALTQRS